MLFRDSRSSGSVIFENVRSSSETLTLPSISLRMLRRSRDRALVLPVASIRPLPVLVRIDRRFILGCCSSPSRNAARRDYRLPIIGCPYPPPPGVSITKLSPEFISIWSHPSSSTTSPPARYTRLRPVLPDEPPAMPYGAIRLCPERIAAVIGSRKHTRRIAPFPPRQRPAPPLPRRISKLSRSTGKRHSSTSGSVRRELVMWVWTTSAPSNPSPAPDPPATVS